jgi:hypothetical protein
LFELTQDKTWLWDFMLLAVDLLVLATAGDLLISSNIYLLSKKNPVPMK